MPSPTISEQFSPERTILSLPLGIPDEENVAINSNEETGDKKVAINSDNDKSGDKMGKKSHKKSENDVKSDKKSEDKKVAINPNEEKTGDKIVAINPNDKTGDKKPEDKTAAAKTAVQKEQIIKYMTDNAVVKSSEIATLLDITVSRVKVLLAELQREGLIVAEGANRNRVYKLKY